MVDRYRGFRNGGVWDWDNRFAARVADRHAVGFRAGNRCPRKFQLVRLRRDDSDVLNRCNHLLASNREGRGVLRAFPRYGRRVYAVDRRGTRLRVLICVLIA